MISYKKKKEETAINSTTTYQPATSIYEIEYPNTHFEFLGIEPCFNVPGYIEFRIEDYQHELGIIDSKYEPAGAIAYWHVDELQATLDKLISLGEQHFTKLSPIIVKDKEVFSASVIDPFGNILRIMTNKHYL
jgi:hypothetical protein